MSIKKYSAKIKLPTAISHSAKISSARFKFFVLYNRLVGWSQKTPGFGSPHPDWSKTGDRQLVEATVAALGTWIVRVNYLACKVRPPNLNFLSCSLMTLGAYWFRFVCGWEVHTPRKAVGLVKKLPTPKCQRHWSERRRHPRVARAGRVLH